MSDTPSRLFRTIAADDLYKLPDPRYQLEPFILAGGFNVLFGPSGCGKSFLALDWSACIAAGLSWYGQASMQGPVVYISAEGAGGLKRRYAAWKHARGVDSVPGLTFIPEAVNLLDPAQVVRVQDTIDALGEPPAMFVVDTMARSMVGGDENSSKDVGLLIDHIDVLKERYRSAALTVHHTGTEGERERGSTSLRGASDITTRLKPDGSSLRLTSIKEKDAAPFNPWRLHLKTCLESVVIGPGASLDLLGPAELQILETVQAAFGTSPVPATRLLDASGIPRSSYFVAVKSLQDAGFLTSGKSGRSTLYTITEKGINQLVQKGLNGSKGTNPDRSSEGSRSIGRDLSLEPAPENGKTPPLAPEPWLNLADDGAAS